MMFRTLLFSLFVTFSVGCVESDEDCSSGSEGCECLQGECLVGLACRSNVCVNLAGSNPESEGETESNNDGGGGSGGCSVNGSVIPNGEFYCESNVVYQCLSSSGDQIANCNRCTYTGSGTGHDYDTRCKREAGNDWDSAKYGSFPGPGCYFGSTRICKDWRGR